MDNNKDLPLHVFNGTKKDALENLSVLRGQLEQAKRCEKFPCVKISCAKCAKRVSLFMLFKCLYCGLWFCKSCAERHFGERVPASVLIDEPWNHKVPTEQGD